MSVYVDHRLCSVNENARGPLECDGGTQRLDE
jgi:hypothetical protein